MNFLSEQMDKSDIATIDMLMSKWAVPGLVVIELGTFTGRSAMAMLPHVRQMKGKLYCVDWFRGSPGVKDRITEDYRRYNVLDTFLSNITEAGYDNYVTTVVGSTDSAVSIVADGTADFIFLDADHRYSQVRKDIINWYPKLKDGGVFFGHDFEKHLRDCDYGRALEKCEEDFVDACHYGVIRAVCELFPQVQCQGRIWYVRKDVCSRVEKTELPEPYSLWLRRMYLTNPYLRPLRWVRRKTWKLTDKLLGRKGTVYVK